MKKLLIVLSLFALVNSCEKSGLYYREDGIANFSNNNTGDQYTDYGENPFISAGEDPVSTFGIDADGASYSNMRGYESDGYRIPSEAVRIEEFIN